MPAHPHAELMVLYAQDAAETDEPWKRWQWCKAENRVWHSVTYSSMMFHPSYEFRRKPAPFELWAVLTNDGQWIKTLDDEEAAISFASFGGRRVVHMKEVV